ncbi:unnamed protein product [Schistosoma curassoni]|nr:unnamed protein product [Schistosoma curassoni]
MISLEFLRYCLRDWLFFSNLTLFLILDLYSFINFHWNSNDSHVTHIVGSWTIVDDLGSQVFIFPAKNGPSLTIKFSRRFLLTLILRTLDRRNFL